MYGFAGRITKVIWIGIKWSVKKFLKRKSTSKNNDLSCCSILQSLEKSIWCLQFGFQFSALFFFSLENRRTPTQTTSSSLSRPPCPFFWQSSILWVIFFLFRTSKRYILFVRDAILVICSVPCGRQKFLSTGEERDFVLASGVSSVNGLTFFHQQIPNRFVTQYAWLSIPYF